MRIPGKRSGVTVSMPAFSYFRPVLTGHKAPGIQSEAEEFFVREIRSEFPILLETAPETDCQFRLIQFPAKIPRMVEKRHVSLGQDREKNVLPADTFYCFTVNNGNYPVTFNPDPEIALRIVCDLYPAWVGLVARNRTQAGGSRRRRFSLSTRRSIPRSLGKGRSPASTIISVARRISRIDPFVLSECSLVKMTDAPHSAAIPARRAFIPIESASNSSTTLPAPKKSGTATLLKTCQ